MSKSTDSVKLTPSNGEGDTGPDHIQSEIPKQDSDVGSELEDNVKELIEENESLRKGMHEILDSVHNQDGKVKMVFLLIKRFRLKKLSENVLNCSFNYHQINVFNVKNLIFKKLCKI